MLDVVALAVLVMVVVVHMLDVVTEDVLVTNVL